MYYTNIKDYDQLQRQREKGSSDNGGMRAVLLAIMIGVVTAFLI